MGREPGRATPRHCRALIGSAALATALIAGGASPAHADDPAPTPVPAVGSTVSPPSQQQIDDARSALERLQQQGTRVPEPALAEVAGPAAADRRGSVTARISDDVWWTVGAGLLVLLVASEATRLSARRAKHRGRA
jgi:hypothetical protein